MDQVANSIIELPPYSVVRVVESLSLYLGFGALAGSNPAPGAKPPELSRPFQEPIEVLLTVLIANGRMPIASVGFSSPVVMPPSWIPDTIRRAEVFVWAVTCAWHQR